MSTQSKTDAALAAWKLSPVGQWAQVYTNYGFAVFPCHGITDGKCTCGKHPCGESNKQAGKHPYTKNGVKDSSSNIEVIASRFNYRTDLNIAIATGAPSGVFVVDIDNRGDISGEDSIKDMQEENGRLPDTLTSITGSGRHLIFKMPDFDVRNATEIAPKVDIRGSGGYIICAPSAHHSGATYSFDEASYDHGVAEAPEWLLAMLRPKPKKVKALSFDYSSGALPEWSKDDVYNMLSCITPDLAYDDWLHIGMALHHGGYPLSMWDSWSRGSDKYQSGDCEKRWHGFGAHDGITMGTLIDRAQHGGWKPAPYEHTEKDTSNVDAFVARMSADIAKSNVKALEANHGETPAPVGYQCRFNFNPLELPELLGDTVRSINKYAMYKQPELALINVIAAAGAVFGRKYASPMNARTNLYMVGVARTAGGKDFSRQYISGIFERAGLQDFLGANYIRSDTGMLVNMQTSPSQVMMLDEFGMYMEALCNTKAPPHIRNVSSVLTKLFTSSGNIYDHGATADSKTRIVLQRPNLCIYGTTTEESYASALKRKAIASGDLNRFLVYKSVRTFTGNEAFPPKFELDEDLIAMWKRHSAGSSMGLPNISGIAPTPIVVEWDDEIQAIVRECMVKQNDMINCHTATSELWGRYAELVTKIAMIFAIAGNKQCPTFKRWHMDIARNIVDTCLGYMIHLAEDHVSDTDYETSQQRVLVFLRSRSGGVPMTELNNKFRSIKAKERRDLLVDMINQNVISVSRENDIGVAGRPREIVRAL